MKSSNWKKGGRNWGCLLVASFIIAFLFLMVMGPVLEDGNDEDTFYIWLVILIVPVIISFRMFFAEAEHELSYDNVKLILRDWVAYEVKSNKPYSGNAVELWPHGQKKKEATYKDGKLDGLETQWYESGQKEHEFNYKDGEEDGVVTYWHVNGQKQLEFNYKDGEEDGVVTYWHENGQKQHEVKYKHGKELEDSKKWWNSKGEPVDSEEESEAE